MLFPTDIYTVNNCGGYKFIRKNYRWPVNDKKINNIINKFHNDFFLKSESLDSYTKNILYVDFTFIYFISYSIHFKILEKILQKKKNKILIGNNSKIFIDVNFKKLSDPFLNNKSKIERFFLLHLKFIIKNLIRFNFFSFKFQSRYLSVGGDSTLINSYIKKKKISTIYSYPELFIDAVNNSKYIEKYKKILNPILKNLSKNIKKEFNITLDLSEFLGSWSSRCSILNSSMDAMLGKDYKYKGILVSDVYKVPSRFLALYFLLKKKESICFDHGNHANGRKKHRLITSQCLSYNKFITISKRSKESIIKSNMLSITRKSLRNIKIDYTKNELLSKIFIKNKKIINTPSMNVMLMGWPMNSRKYFDEGPCSFFYNKILFEIEIIKFLKKNKFKVFYKAHPERVDGIKCLYEKFVDEIFYEKFENINKYQFIDTLIFTNTCSSSFGSALCTNKKIILLYNEKYFEDHLKILKQRLIIVPCSFDTKYRIDYNVFLKELKKKKSNFSYKYVENFFM